MSKQHKPCTIKENNISVAWAKAYLASTIPTSTILTPLFVRISDIGNDTIPEDSLICAELEKYITISSDTTANTIFPRSLWNPQLDKKELFKRYHNLWPLIRKYPTNHYGTYFKRLISWNSNGFSTGKNQLEHIIDTYKKENHRSSALQASIFDPERDHTGQRQRGFPCMQQIIFTQVGRDLEITGVYASQYLFKRAYGNYLGLCRLGQFVAHETNLQFVTMNCYTAKAQMEEAKYKVENLTEFLKDKLIALGIYESEIDT